MTEDQIHKSIVQWLRTVLPDAVIHHSPNEGNRGGRAGQLDGARRKAMGMAPGYPDLVVYYYGHVLHFEVKTAKGRLSAPQTAMREFLRGQGHQCEVVRSVDDVRNLLGVWGLTTREKLVDIPLRGVVR